jgi:hypothetical protein
MGKVVIYLPAEFERKLREDGHDPAEWIREEVRKIVLDEGGLRRKVILRKASKPVLVNADAIGNRQAPATRRVDVHFKPDPE